MGALWASLASHEANGSGHAPRAQALRLSEQDALALCEAGDLLLAREALEHRALHLRLELAVARDVGRVQRGRFPRQLATALPAWTSCELLVRHSGHLYVLRAQADGVHLTPFRDRVRGGGDGNRFAIRRLQRGVSTALLRELGEELAPVALFHWQQLLESQADASGTPQRRQQTPPLLTSILSRALELWKTNMLSSEHTKAPIDLPSATTIGTNSSTALEMQDVDASDAVGMLNSALVAAVYERLGVLSLESPLLPLLPTSFASTSSHNSMSDRSTTVDTAGDKPTLALTPPDALGAEMRLVVSPEQTPSPST